MTTWPLGTGGQPVREDGTPYRPEKLPAQTALRTGEVVLDLYEAGKHVESLPLIRSVYESALTAMWVAKWAYAWLFVDRRRIVDSVRKQISFRTGGEYAGAS